MINCHYQQYSGVPEKHRVNFVNVVRKLLDLGVLQYRDKFDEYVDFLKKSRIVKLFVNPGQYRISFIQ